MVVNKKLLHQHILQALVDVKIAAFKSAQTAHDNATHTENVADNKYDTLALEEAYLAFGQTQRVLQCDEDIETFKALNIIDFEEDDEIKIGALIELEDQKSKNISVYFLSPCCGGVKLKIDEMHITLITATAPLGKLLLGKQVDDEICLNVESAIQSNPQRLSILNIY